MTTANMKLVVLGVTFPDALELSDAKLDEGEHITKRVVELTRLYDELQGTYIWNVVVPYYLTLSCVIQNTTERSVLLRRHDADRLTSNATGICHRCEAEPFCIWAEVGGTTLTLVAADSQGRIAQYASIDYMRAGYCT